MKYIIIFLLFSRLLVQKWSRQEQNFLDKDFMTNTPVFEETSFLEKKRTLPIDEFPINYLVRKNLNISHFEENNMGFLAYNEKKESKTNKTSYKKIKLDSCKKYFVEFKPAYFHYQDNVARSIFGHGGYMSIFGFDVEAYKYLHVWIDLGFLFDSGKVKSANAKERVTFLPLSLGLKYLYKINNQASLYAKTGPNWTYVSTKVDYPYIQQRVSKNDFGALFGIGSLISLDKNFSLDLFFDYIYNKKSFIDSNSNLRLKRYFGGFAMGIGLEYGF